MRPLIPSFVMKDVVTTSNGGGESDVVETTPVYLNVYDLTPVNSYMYWFGLGIFHSGIEVHGMEYGFGAHEYATSGVFEVEPRNCPGFIFRRSIPLGTTDMSRSEFRLFMEHISKNYNGDSYHLIAKNCNHFTNDICTQLTGKPIPGWVNRLAGIASGSICNCLLPESIRVAAIRHVPDQVECSEGSESLASSTSSESDGEHADHHLLVTPNTEVAYLKDKPVRLARELM